MVALHRWVKPHTHTPFPRVKWALRFRHWVSWASVHCVPPLHLFSAVRFAPLRITAPHPCLCRTVGSSYCEQFASTTHIFPLAQTRKRKYFYYVLDFETTVVVLAEPETLKFIGRKIFERGKRIQPLQFQQGGSTCSCYDVRNRMTK